MCIKKIIVTTGTRYPEGLDGGFLRQITKEFSMYVFPFTTNMRLLRKAKAVCNSIDSKRSLHDRFKAVVNDRFYTLSGSGNLRKTLRYLGNPTTLHLDYTIGMPGGLGLDEKDGIYYFLHTKELRHAPHIHARYQGKTISIDILTLKVHGKFKNKKKMREAVGYVKAKQNELLEQYNKKTNGIHVENFLVVDGESTPVPW
jgi:hypothetical protein